MSEDNKKLGFFGYFRPLLCENGAGLSLGRIGLWITLAPAIDIWWKGGDIKENHLYVLAFFLAYNCYKKIPMFIKFVKAWKGTDIN